MEDKMYSQILVAYATKYGATEEIADSDLSPYKAAVMGGTAVCRGFGPQNH
jgi:menaquinone-dependent protoporphyrinogen IX oxidase